MKESLSSINYSWLLNDLILRIERWLDDEEIPAVAGVSIEQVKARIIQKIFGDINYQVGYKIGVLIAQNHSPSLRNINQVVTENLTVCTRTGAIQFARKYRLINILRTLGGVVIRGIDLFHWQKESFDITQPATLLMGVPNSQLPKGKNDSPFISFCDNGPVKPITNAKILLVSSGKHKLYRKCGRIHIVPECFRYFMQGASLKFLAKVRLIYKMIVSALKYIKISFRCPALSMINPEIANAIIVNELNKERLLDSAIITNALMNNQDLWMRLERRDFKTHLINYSDDPVPLKYRVDENKCEHPVYRHICVDEQWVWTREFERSLRRNGHSGPIHVVDPILFYLPRPDESLRPKQIRVAIFDVTPVTEKRALQLGIFPFYHNYENEWRFISEIVDTCSIIEKKLGAPISILYKRKRDPVLGVHHDLRYVRQVDEMISQNERIENIEVRENIFTLLRGCDLSISSPFTSTAIVSKYIGTNAIYYDPSGLLHAPDDRRERITFVSGAIELERVIRKMLKSTAQG